MKRIAIPTITKELCHYGCGQIAKYRNGSGNLMCDDRCTKCPKNKESNSLGLAKAHLEGRLNTNHLTRKHRQGNLGKRHAVFGNPGKGDFKNSLLTERGHQCENCKLSEWLGQPIMLELEHTDGCRQNNTRENLKLLCPNCHSQTPTWRGRNIPGKKGKIVSDEKLLKALKEESNIYKALVKVGLTPRGANYSRCHNLLNAPVM